MKIEFIFYTAEFKDSLVENDKSSLRFIFMRTFYSTFWKDRILSKYKNSIIATTIAMISLDRTVLLCGWTPLLYFLRKPDPATPLAQHIYNGHAEKVLWVSRSVVAFPRGC